MILVHLAFFLHVCLIDTARVLTTFSSLSLSVKLEVLRFLRAAASSLMNDSSSLLFFTIENLDVMMFSSVIEMVIVSEVWSEESRQSGWIKWLLSSEKPLHRNMRSMTELDSLSGVEYLVGTWLVGTNKSKLKESVIIIRLSLIEE